MTETMTQLVSISDGAAEQVRTLLTQQDNANLGLRVFVTAGGCSGLSYGMALEEQAEETDTIIEDHGIRIFIDEFSSPYLVGAEIDYVDSLMGGGFTVNNPNAVSSCGCGHSFQTADGGSSGGGCGSCH